LRVAGWWRPSSALLPLCGKILGKMINFDQHSCSRL
jgi:hypothetical protein